MITTIAAAFYISAWAWLLARALKRNPLKHAGIQLLLLSGLIFHSISTYQSIYTSGGLDLSFFKIAPLFFAVIHALLLVSSLRKPLLNLFLLLIPFTLLSLFADKLFPSEAEHTVRLSFGLALHVILSVLAYSLLTIATFQSLLLAYQDRQLKKKALRKVLVILPPLQTMEALLFELLWAGQIVLTLSIVTGVMFIENIFAQQLSHKTVFSILSWLIYSTLLWGRWRYGWRGASAIKWTLGGFCALILAYFGSKMVLEIVLGG